MIALILALLTASGPNPTSAPAASPVPTATAIPTPAPTATPPPHFPQRDANGIVRYVYDAGVPAMIYCAIGSQCAIRFDTGEVINHYSIVKGASGEDVWPVQPSNPTEQETDRHYSVMYVAPLPGSPPTVLFVETAQHLYMLALRVDPHANGVIYGFRYPDASNTVILPTDVARTYQYQSDDAAVASQDCPAHGYASSERNAPPFHTTGITIAEGVVRIDFAPTTPLPNVGAPIRDITDIDNLSALPTTPDYAPDRRSIIVLACYPTIVLYTNTAHGRAAIVLTSY